MSAEVAAPDAAPTPSLDKNAQAAEDAKKMLAELQGETTAPTAPSDTKEASQEEASGVRGEKPTSEDEKMGESSKDKDKKAESEGKSNRRERDDGRPSRGGARGRGGYQVRNFRDNIKSDLTSQEESSDPEAIRKQVEFYFSDSNLPMDKFLLSKVGGSENHPVDLKIIHSFKRMRHFQPFEAVVAAMKDSTILKLTDNDTCVQRIEPLPESLNNGPVEEVVKVFEDRAMPRSIYAKGFGEEVPSTQFDIEAFFAPYGPTNAIRLRRSDTKVFKGSVFVEFASEELQKNFLELDPKPKFKGKDLQIMSKKAYCDGKVEDIKSGKIRPNDRQFKKHDSHHGGRDRRKRDDEDDRDWRERREDDRRGGFKNDRRGGRNRRGSPDYHRGGKGHTVERNPRGVPVVGTSEPKSDKSPESKSKREAATVDALAKAKAMVEAEQKKSAKPETEAEKKEPDEKVGESADQEAKAAELNVTASGTNGNSEEVTSVGSKKRAREEDEEAGPETKKVDTKAEGADAVNGES